MQYKVFLISGQVLTIEADTVDKVPGGAEAGFSFKSGHPQVEVAFFNATGTAGVVMHPDAIANLVEPS